MKLKTNGLLYKYISSTDNSRMPTTLCELLWRVIGVSALWALVTVAACCAFFILVWVPLETLYILWFSDLPFEEASPGIFVIGLLWLGLCNYHFTEYLKPRYYTWKQDRNQKAAIGWIYDQEKPPSTWAVAVRIFKDFKEKTCTRIEWE